MLITDQAWLDLRRILHFIHPRATEQSRPLTVEDYQLGLSTLIEQVAQAVIRVRPTHIILDQKAKEGSQTGQLLLTGHWPPAFDLRQETEDETFAREALSSLASEGFFEEA